MPDASRTDLVAQDVRVGQGPRHERSGKRATMTNRPRLVPRSKAAAPAFSFLAPKPALSGVYGERDAECTVAEVQSRGNKTQLVLTFETADGEVGRMWVQLQSPLTSTCRFMRLVAKALGRAPEPGTPIHPVNVFVGKSFRVRVGWRTDGKDPGTAKTGPKDPKDFLRVCDLIERLHP